MSDLQFSLISSAILVGSFVLSIQILIPKAIEQWRLWQKSGKSTHISMSAAAAFAAFCLLSGIFAKVVRVLSLLGSLP